MVIGITGGIGAGKSTVMQYMGEYYSVYTILADEVARELQKQGGEVYRQIIKWLGTEVLKENGELDRERLAAIVFSDESKRQTLNGIVHPAVRRDIEKQIVKQRQHYSHVAVEAALLIEEGYRDVCDEFWYVDASEEVRIRRLMESRGYTREKCRAIMAQQLDRETFLQESDRVIVNNGSMDELKRQLDCLLV